MTPPRLYTTKEAEAELGISDARVRQLCKELDIYRHGRNWLLTEADLALLRHRIDNPIAPAGWPKGKPRKPQNS